MRIQLTQACSGMNHSPQHHYLLTHPQAKWLLLDLQDSYQAFKILKKRDPCHSSAISDLERRIKEQIICQSPNNVNYVNQDNRYLVCLYTQQQINFLYLNILYQRNFQMQTSKIYQQITVEENEAQQLPLASDPGPLKLQKSGSTHEMSQANPSRQKEKIIPFRSSYLFNIIKVILLIALLTFGIYQLYPRQSVSDNLSQIDQDSRPQNVKTHNIGLQIIDKKNETELLIEELSILLSNKLPSQNDLPLNNPKTFSINSQVWQFQKQSPNYLESLMTANNKRFAQLSKFKVNTLNSSNYHSYLSEIGNTILQMVLQILKERMDKDEGLKSNYDLIQKRLILFSILYERGGVVIDSPLTLTENFNWIRQIKNNIYVNRGDAEAEPQVVGFYSPLYSSDIKKQQKTLKEGMEEVDRYMVLFPAIESYFIAAKKRTQFIGKMLDEMISILIFPESIVKDIENGKYQYFNLKSTDVYYQYSFLAGQRVIQAKQLKLDTENNNPNTRNFAIDYYGLFLINSYYGPYKLSVILNGVRFEKKIQNIAKYDMQEYEANIGPMRYLQITAFSKQLNGFLSQIRGKKLQNKIMKGSFVQKMYFPQGSEPFIYKNPQKRLTNLKAPRWESLPKIIWVFWDSGLANAPVQAFLCVQNLRKMSKSQGFEIKEVNNSNLADYLDSATLQRIDYTLKNAKLIVYPQTKSDLIRLALLYKHGGVYLDASIIAVQSFDWLVNIARFPSQYIFNRYGELPSVLLFWNPNFGGFLEWEIDQVANTKAGWRYCYQNSILIAAKQSQFIRDWFDLLLQLLLKSFSETLKVYEQCNMSAFTRIKQKDQYLLAMDTIKCVIGQKQVWINRQNKMEWKNGMDYYKIWTMTTFFGPFKIRSNMNYANIDRAGNNPFLTRYSQEYVQGIIGKMHFMLKFVTQQRYGIVKFIEDNFDKLKEETHSQSLFMKYLYDPKQGRLEKQGGKMILIKTNE